jgi:hypothetical protein
VDLWICGSVHLWICGSVDLWICGFVDLWICGSVDLWICGSVRAIAFRTSRGMNCQAMCKMALSQEEAGIIIGKQGKNFRGLCSDAQLRLRLQDPTGRGGRHDAGGGRWSLRHGQGQTWGHLSTAADTLNSLPGTSLTREAVLRKMRRHGFRRPTAHDIERRRLELQEAGLLVV